MEMSVREARAQFAHALAAAERGERVTITKNGKAVAELVPPSKPRKKWDWDEFDRIQQELGIAKREGGPIDVDWDADHAWSREVLGMSDGSESPRR
jgi:prevent-host-death family protein